MRFVILGGGPAGYAAAQAASALGAEVTLVEDQGLGGNCDLTDAIPSKTLIATANVMAEIERAETLGVAVRARPARRSTCCAPSPTPAGSPRTSRAASATGWRARRRASSPAPGHVSAPDGVRRRHRAAAARGAVRRAAGLRPARALGAAVLPRRPRPRLHDPRGARPARAAAAPAGGRRRRDGLRVRGVLRLLRLARDAALGPLADPAGRGPRRRRDRPGGVPGPRHGDLQFNARASSVERTRRGRARPRPRTAARFAGSHAIICMGQRAEHRRARPGGRSASSSTTAARSSSTSTCSTAEHVYAAGDVAGGMMLASTAAMQGRHAALHALGARARRCGCRTSPWTIFTRPECASVGLTESRRRWPGRAPSRSPSTTSAPTRAASSPASARA